MIKFKQNNKTHKLTVDVTPDIEVTIDEKAVAARAIKVARQQAVRKEVEKMVDRILPKHRRHCPPWTLQLPL